MAHTTIDHEVRKQFDLTLNEYAICDSIYYLSRDRFCNASKDYLGEFIGISKRSVHKILNILEKKGLILRTKQGIKTTFLWNESVQKMHGVKKVHSDSEESSPGTVKKVHSDSEESSHNTNNINTDISTKINTNSPIGDTSPYKKMIDRFHKAYMELNDGEKIKFSAKECSNIKKLLKEKTENFEMRFDCLFKLCTLDAFYKMTPSCMVSMWNDLTKAHLDLKLQKIKPEKQERKICPNVRDLPMGQPMYPKPRGEE